jgi:hypothetical protein
MENNEYPVIQNIQSPLNLAKVNPVGREVPEIQQSQDKALDATDDLIKSLEERYAQPNWYKIAAGFAKPQLGGFMASLGSASEAAGAQQEAQRSIAPTVARMRAEVASGRSVLAQSTEQERAIKEYDKNGKYDINALRHIYSLNPGSAIAQSIEKRPEFEQERRNATEASIKAQKETQANPSLQIVNQFNDMFKPATMSPDRQNQYINAVNTTIPSGQSPEKWNALSFSQKQDIHLKNASDSNRQGLEEGQKSSMDAEQAHDVLDDLTVLRTLSTDEKLKPLFSLASNGDLFSQYRAFLDKYGGNQQAAVEGLVNASMEKLKNADDITRAKADKLIKGIAELDIRLRSGLNNPTDAASYLSTQRSPSLMNSQAGFVGILDQLGLNSYRTIEMNNLRHKKGLTKSDLMSTDEAIAFRNETRRLREQLAEKSALDQTPSWFYPGEKAKNPSSSVQEQTPTVSTNTSKPKSSNERVIGGVIWERQPDGSYKNSGRKP